MVLTPPGKPRVHKDLVTHDSIYLEWTHPDFGHDLVDYYEIQTRRFEYSQGAWKTYTVDRENNTFLINTLDIKSQYCFKVCPICKDSKGKGCESEMSDPIMTKVTSPPGKPSATAKTHNSITLEWKTPTDGSNYLKSYTIFYRMDVSGDWQKQETLSQETGHTVKYLQPKSSYYFKLRSVCDEFTFGVDSEVSDIIETNPVCIPGKPKATAKTHYLLSHLG